MEIYSAPRGGGKTTLLIIISHYTKARIITATSKGAENVKALANKLGFSIPDPMCWSSYTDFARGRRDEKILLDDLEHILNNIFFNQDILTATMTDK